MGSNVLIILGMHRSGTSLTANWLNRCGLNVGDNLEIGNFSNVNGHFEDVDFLGLHEALLEESGLHRWGLYDLREFPLDSEQKKRLGALVTRKNKLRPQWGWKEPRTCLFLNYYRELLPDAKYFVVFRDIGSVVSSLIRRDVGLAVAEKEFRGVFSNLKRRKYIKEIEKEILGKNRDSYIKAWKIYNSAIIDHLKNTPENNYLVLSYDKIPKHEKGILQFFIDSGFLLDYVNFDSIFDSSLINKPRKHNIHIDNDIFNIESIFFNFINASISKLIQ